MPETLEKQAQIAALLTGEPVLARLATTDPKTMQPHVTPVWFLWDGERIWISAFISTRKARNIERNRKIAVIVEPKCPDGGLQAVLLEGSCEFLAPPDERVPAISLKIYERYVGPAQITEKERSWTTDPENRLIVLTPRHIYSW